VQSKTVCLVIFVAVCAYQVGAWRGLAACPAQAKVNADREAAIQRDLDIAFSAPTGRELLCDKVFADIAAGLHAEQLSEQNAIDSSKY